jgi:hypothetical protein
MAEISNHLQYLIVNEESEADVCGSWVIAASNQQNQFNLTSSIFLLLFGLPLLHQFYLSNLDKLSEKYGSY